jgi:hypothetical protein
MSSGMALLSMLGIGQARALEARRKRQRNAADAILEGREDDESKDEGPGEPRMDADERGWEDGDGWRNRG